MNMVPIMCLVAAVFAAPLHAQVCSGGTGGGTDASGNQCGEAAATGAYADGAGIASPRPAAKMTGIQQSKAAPIVTLRPAKMSSAPILSTPREGPSRIAKTALQPTAAVKTSKIDSGGASSCSGGTGGGTDATGNECSRDSVAAVNTGTIVATRP